MKFVYRETIEEKIRKEIAARKELGRTPVVEVILSEDETKQFKKEMYGRYQGTRTIAGGFGLAHVPDLIDNGIYFYEGSIKITTK